MLAATSHVGLCHASVVPKCCKQEELLLQRAGEPNAVAEERSAGSVQHHEVCFLACNKVAYPVVQGESRRRAQGEEVEGAERIQLVPRELPNLVGLVEGLELAEARASSYI
eukprot:759697-Hanusia_phi.AAC.3